MNHFGTTICFALFSFQLYTNDQLTAFYLRSLIKPGYNFKNLYKPTVNPLLDDKDDERRGEECKAEHDIERHHKRKYLIIYVLDLKNKVIIMTWILGHSKAYDLHSSRGLNLLFQSLELLAAIYNIGHSKQFILPITWCSIPAIDYSIFSSKNYKRYLSQSTNNTLFRQYYTTCEAGNQPTLLSVTEPGNEAVVESSYTDTDRLHSVDSKLNDHLTLAIELRTTHFIGSTNDLRSVYIGLMGSFLLMSYDRVKEKLCCHRNTVQNYPRLGNGIGCSEKEFFLDNIDFQEMTKYSLDSQH